MKRIYGGGCFTKVSSFRAERLKRIKPKDKKILLFISIFFISISTLLPENWAFELGAEEVTLFQKAQHYEENLQKRHYTLEGLVVYSVKLPVTSQEDIEAVNFLADVAAWTGCYLASQAFRFKVTHQARALENIRKTLKGLHMLQAVTGKKGLLARNLRKAEGPSAYEENAGEWHQGKGEFSQYRWRGDVSVDQYDGVMFGYSICYDLVEEEDVRKRIAEDVTALVDHIIEHGMTIEDIDGKRTTWGNLSPSTWEDLNCLLALTFLKIAFSITGQERFHRKYLELIERHNYHKRAVSARKKWWEYILGVNHSDDHLAFLAYYNLLRLEKDPELLSYYQKSLERTWSSNKDEGNSFFNFVYCALNMHKRGQPEFGKAMADAIETLRLFPLDKRVFEVINSKRKDIKKSFFRDRRGRLQAKSPLPINERPVDTYEWKANPYRLDGHRGAKGEVEYAGVDYLLAYWMGRYHGFILEGM